MTRNKYITTCNPFLWLTTASREVSGLSFRYSTVTGLVKSLRLYLNQKPSESSPE